MRLISANPRRAVAAALAAVIALGAAGVAVVGIDGAPARSAVTIALAERGDGAVPVRQLDESPPRSTVAGLRRPQPSPDVPRPSGTESSMCDVSGAVAVELDGLKCARAAAVARGRGGSAAGEDSGLICTSGAGLTTTCLDPRSGKSMTLTHGPGGPDLRDCGFVPVGVEATPVSVRASIDCADAARIAFRYHENPVRKLASYTCSSDRQAGVPIVTCDGSDGEVAFVRA